MSCNLQVGQLETSSREVEFALSHDHDIIGWRAGGMGGTADSRSWFDVLWNNRDRLLGMAHTHPDAGHKAGVHPSSIDLNSWQSLEIGFGFRLLNYVVNRSSVCEVRLVQHVSTIKYETRLLTPDDQPWWVSLIRELSYGR
jgi:hypothetical protein